MYTHTKKINSQTEIGKKITKSNQKKKEAKKQANRTIFGFFLDNVSYILQTGVWTVSTVINYVYPKKTSAIKLSQIENNERISVKRFEEKKRIELFKLQNETKQFLEQLKRQPNLLFSFFSATIVTMPARLCTHGLLDTYSVFDARSIDFSSTLLIIAISQALQRSLGRYISNQVNMVCNPNYEFIDPFNLMLGVEKIDEQLNEVKDIISRSKRGHYTSQTIGVIGGALIACAALLVFFYKKPASLLYQPLEFFHDFFVIGLSNTTKSCFNYFRNFNQDLSSRQIDNFSKKLKKFGISTDSFELEDNAFNQRVPSNIVNEHVFQAPSLLSQHLLLKLNSSEKDVDNISYFLKKLGFRIELVSEEYMVVKIIKNKTYDLNEMIREFKSREKALDKLEKLYPVIRCVCVNYFQSALRYKLYIQNNSNDPIIKLIVPEEKKTSWEFVMDFFQNNFKNVFCCIIAGKLQIEFNSESNWLGSLESISTGKQRIKENNSLNNIIIENKVVGRDVILISEKDNKSFQYEKIETKKEKSKTKGIPFLNGVANNSYTDLRKNKRSVAPPEDYTHYKVEADGKTFYTKVKYFTYFSSETRQVKLIVDAEELKRKKKDRAYFKNTFKRNFTRNNLRIANEYNDKGIKKLSEQEAKDNFQTDEESWKMKVLDDKSAAGKTYKKVIFTPAKKDDKNKFITFNDKTTEYEGVVIFNKMMRH